jgi:cytochrome P450
LIFAEGREHSAQKQQFQSLMSRQALAHYELHLLQPVIDNVVSELSGVRGEGGLIRADVVDLVRTMLHRISAAVTGVDGVDTQERTKRFRELVTVLGEATAGQFSTLEKDAVIEEGKRALQALVDEFLQSSLDRRIELVRRYKAGEIEKNDLSQDMLTMLCLHDDLSRPEDGEKIPYIWRQCSLFLTAAIQTTTHTLPHVIVHLDEWFQEHPEDRAKAGDPDFLRKAVAESLRLHQTSPVKFRIAAKDVTLSTGRKVSEGEMVALFAPPANLEPELFGEDSRYFNPYRQVPKGQAHWGLTFGSGIHMCLGRNLVVGIQGKGDDKFGTHGTMVRIVKTLYDLGAELDPDNPVLRNTASYHDTFESVPVILRKM